MNGEPMPGVVTFVQYDLPRLLPGEYTVEAEQRVNQGTPDRFSATTRVAVTAPRFAIDPAALHSVFPPPLANGELSLALPHAAFTSQTLPWQRASVPGKSDAPWLAILLFDEEDAPEAVTSTAAALIPAGQEIAVLGSTITGVGTMPAHHLSYPDLNPLDYGETPQEECTIIDVPVATFNRVAPAQDDLPLLAEIREVDTVDSPDTAASSVRYAIVSGNRLGVVGATNHVFLVSLENMGPLLPSADGTQSPAIPADVSTIRLTCLTSWTFMANDLDQTFEGLLENLNRTDGFQGLSSLQVPFAGPRPTSAEVQQALDRQATGNLTQDDARVLVRNASEMAYLPVEHYLRHAGQTVSWYRGPLAPYEVAEEIEVPISCPDAANHYNPATGMFDVSYGAAWQLGQLLALQDSGFSTTLYAWKRKAYNNLRVAAQHERLEAMRHDPEVLTSFFDWRQRGIEIAAETNDPPASVVEWLAQLMLLVGVPFQYLVQDESMLPPESLRVFHLDPNWMQALFDGAFSIGRATTGELGRDAAARPQLHGQVVAARRTMRRNPARVTAPADDAGDVTGFLMRSQLVAGWPNVQVTGYSDPSGEDEIPKLRVARLADQVLLGLFEGVIGSIAFHQAPEQLHFGVERIGADLTTTLRAVTGPAPGKQFLIDPKGGLPVAVIPARADGRTLKIRQGADNILRKLNDDFNQGITTFTSAELALEMIKGVVKVLFRRPGGPQ